LRWSIEGRGVPTTSACAESGLFQVRARAYTNPNDDVAEIVLPCSAAALEDPEATVDGSTLPPGHYAIELRGIDRNGEPWEDPSLAPLDPDQPHNGCNAVNDYTECRPTDLVCSCLALEVQEDAIVDLTDFVLVPPPECVDGIDNDRDGFVDDNDPGCSVDGGIGGEGIPVGLTELRLDITFLSNNPNATCSSVGVTDVRIDVQTAAGSQVVLDSSCNTAKPYLLSLALPEGAYTFSTVALSSNGEALTDVTAFDAQIRATGGSIVETVDFAAEDFLSPIEETMTILPTFVSALGFLDKGDVGEQPASARGSCGSTSTPGLLDIASLQMRMLNGHGGPLDVPVLLDGTPLDGSARECGSTFLTERALWGGYTVEIEALSAEGEICFSNVGAPTQMRPRESLLVPMARVYDGLEVPASCRDCNVDDDCDDGDNIDAWACLAGVCQLPCTDDLDCESELLGDLGFGCVEVEGYSEPYCQL